MSSAAASSSASVGSASGASDAASSERVTRSSEARRVGELVASVTTHSLLTSILTSIARLPRRQNVLRHGRVLLQLPPQVAKEHHATSREHFHIREANASGERLQRTG